MTIEVQEKEKKEEKHDNKKLFIRSYAEIKFICSKANMHTRAIYMSKVDLYRSL